MLKIKTNFICIKKKKGKEDKFINLFSRFRSRQTTPEKERKREREREGRAWKTGTNGLPCGFGYRRVFCECSMLGSNPILMYTSLTCSAQNIHLFFCE